MKKTESTNKILLLTLADNSQMKVELLPGSRLTFGPTIPGKKNADYNQISGYSLRIYEGKGNDTLVAVFCDVRQFRDISIPVAKMIMREGGKTIWKSDEDGYKVESEVKVERSFEDLKKITG